MHGLMRLYGLNSKFAILNEIIHYLNHGRIKTTRTTQGNRQ